MSETDVEVVVVGGGTMGSATAWQLAQRGHDVVLLEQFEEGHTRGASHGATRNFNMAYGEPDYLELVVEARELWDELTAQTGVQTLDLVGLANHGNPAALTHIQQALDHQKIAYELLTADAAHERWGGMRFQGDTLLLPDSGRVRAADALVAFRAAATAAGAEFRYNTGVRSIEIESEDRIIVRTDTDVIRARRAVVTAGAWADKLLGRLVKLPKLSVSEEQPSHFAITQPDAQWPSFNHMPTPGDAWGSGWNASIYGMLTPGEGVKVGWHRVGEIADPDHRDPAVNERILETLKSYVREWIPGVDPESAVPVHCTYTTTPSEDFVLDRRGPLIVGAGFSGHGFKFSPVIGRVLADLVAGVAPAARFQQLG